MYSLGGNRKTAEEEFNGDLGATITKVSSTLGNKRYYFGYENGTLEARTSTTFQRVGIIKNLGSNIIEVITDEKEFIIVSNKDGELIHVKI